MDLNDELEFAEEAETVRTPKEPWKLLIADDEEEIHRVTKLALTNFSLDGRPLQFLDAYSGHEAVDIVAKNSDIAMVLMDVVMESDNAGLEAVEVIRNKLNNKLLRIVLRTGQPGQAPENEVVTRYDINDYKEKTELTAKKLFTLIYTGLHLFDDLKTTQQTREKLSRIARASNTILRRKLPERLAHGALQLLISLLNIDRSNVESGFHGLVIRKPGTDEMSVLASAGSTNHLNGSALLGKANEVLQALGIGKNGRQNWRLDGNIFTAVLPVDTGHSVGFYLESDAPIQKIEDHVLDVFCRNVQGALHAADLHQVMDKTQRSLIFMLSEAIEKRSRETGNHVRRVGEYSRVLGRLCGMKEDEGDILMIGAALHDSGKITIPDSILNKPGKLTPEERAIMETHAPIGGTMFEGHDLPALKAAMIIAHQHHERWDGMGYPKRLKGEEIHIYGRISALADVYDALGSHRCYKKAWPMEDVLQLIRDERGRHFDPKLVDMFLDNIDQFQAIRKLYDDPPPPTT